MQLLIFKGNNCKTLISSVNPNMHGPRKHPGPFFDALDFHALQAGTGPNAMGKALLANRAAVVLRTSFEELMACTHTHTHIHAYIHTYVHTYTHIYIYIYLCLCMYVCMYVCTYVRTYVCMYVCMYVYIYIYMCGKYAFKMRVMCIWIYTDKSMCKCLYTCTDRHVWIDK